MPNVLGWSTSGVHAWLVLGVVAAELATLEGAHPSACPSSTGNLVLAAATLAGAFVVAVFVAAAAVAPGPAVSANVFLGGGGGGSANAFVSRASPVAPLSLCVHFRFARRRAASTAASFAYDALSSDVYLRANSSSDNGRPEGVVKGASPSCKPLDGSTPSRISASNADAAIAAGMS